MGEKIRSFRELRVYQAAMNSAMEIYQITRNFPAEEKYSLVSQIRRSSRSVCSNLAEAWRRRRYPASFTAKLTDAESEACETQVWIEFARKCHYIDENLKTRLDNAYDRIVAQLVRMIEEPNKWVINHKPAPTY
jgi:four helix bundle protein